MQDCTCAVSSLALHARKSGMRTSLHCRGAIGDHRITSPTAFAENSPSCPRNADGEAVLPDGTAWRKFVMLYMAVMKILSQADEILQVGQSVARRADAGGAYSQLQALFQGQRAGAKLPPLPFLVTNMIKHAGVSPCRLARVGSSSHLVISHGFLLYLCCIGTAILH